MLGYVVSKLGRFIENEMMRNIIGQSHSGFNLAEIMNGKKIFLANLSKGLTGEVNSSLLGMILVSKMQMAAMKRAGGTVLGLDWRLPLDDGWKLIGYDRAVQGNLDPALLFAPLPVLKAAVRDILRRAEGRPGHIFNLGHGILQNTPVENVRAVVEMVHEFSAAPERAGLA